MKAGEFWVGREGDQHPRSLDGNEYGTMMNDPMALTRDFKETIRARVEHDPKFRKELLREGIECMLSGDIATAKTILRDYINATVGFVGLAEATKIPSKSLMRMLGPTGNPRAENLFVIVSFLQNREGVRFQVKAATR
jgi:hypothetical protein